MDNNELAQKIAQHIADHASYCFTQSWEGTVRCDDVDGLSEEIKKVLDEVTE